MLDHCQEQCADVAGKLAQIFGWRHKYEVQRLQRANDVPNSKCVVITQVVSRKHTADSWVAVHSLQSQSDGGILDPDDRLNDVADDREQIIATFEDGEPPVHHGGDGASGSSVGSPSPDMFQGSDKYRTDIEVTNEQIASGTSLQVRRGSEPALNQLLPSTGTSNGHLPVVAEKTSKRWSAAPIIVEPRVPVRKEERGMNGHTTERWSHNDREVSPQRGFTRDGCRLSMQYLGDGPGGMKWMDAADRALNNRGQSLSLPRETRRREPLGQATSSPSEHDSSTQYIVLDTESGALGIHVVPDYDSQGKDQGLLVQGIEPGGRVDRDGRLAVYDRIVEINGHNLLDQPFNVVQDIFRDSLQSPELRLRVVKHKPGVKKPPPPVYPKPPPPLHDRDAMAMVEGEERSVSTTAKVATVSPTKKLPATQPGTHTLQLANTRKIGRKMDLELVKGPHGLGFSITTRDNPAGGNCPIYIKNILPKGAAVEDGRLRPGDRLLAVDGVELTGKSQSEAVALLRNVPPGGRVKIVVSRQDDTSPSPKSVDSGPDSLNSSVSSGVKPLEKEIKTSPQKQTRSAETSQLDESGLYPWRQREILTFDIPVHDSEKAGLGVSVKGKTSANQNANPNSSNGSAIDLGIFVKNVIHGGAASRDGRLRTNDQLLNVNGVSLLGLSNAAAMETLRKAMMRTDGPAPGCITLTVARRVPELRHCNGDSARRDSLSSLLTDSSGQTETFGGPGLDSHATPDNSGTSENSDNTVIFLPPYKQHNHLDGVGMRNPVLERLTGQTHSQGLRNESYYRATHHTTMLLNSNSPLGSPTVNQPPPETVIIEEDSPYIPASVRRVEVDVSVTSPQRGSTSSTQTVDATYASQLSLEEAAAGFSRDAFGRQSMSEKRHATLDAKNTDTYQRNKKLREEREKQRHEELLKHGNNGEVTSKAQLGPSLGMKKSSSLESLQTMVQEIQMQEEVGTYRNAQGAIRVVRGRGCNESFRAAVDRSYDAPLSLRMEPLAEDETEGVLGPRQSSLNTAMDCKMIKAGKKKTGLSLKNLFKFGKHRKEGGGGSEIGIAGEEDREAARRVEQQRMREEQERIQEQYRRLMQRQQEMNQESLHQREQSGGSEGPQSVGGGSSGGGSIGGGEVTRTERIQQLRAQHQRRHAERHRQYPLDEKEERYEAALKQRLEGPEFDPSAMTRPGSRVGITDPARFSHYVNYQEIQQHLNRRQQHYHSQRRDPREVAHRPVSNFYEYESVQAVLRGDGHSNSLPRRQDIAPTHGMSNSHRSSGNYGQPPRLYQPFLNQPQVYHTNNMQQHGYHHNNNNNNNNNKQRKPHGPFVTHVTIRESQSTSPNV